MELMLTVMVAVLAFLLRMVQLRVRDLERRLSVGVQLGNKS